MLGRSHADEPSSPRVVQLRVVGANLRVLVDKAPALTAVEIDRPLANRLVTKYGDLILFGIAHFRDTCTPTNFRIGCGALDLPMYTLARGQASLTTCVTCPVHHCLCPPSSDNPLSCGLGGYCRSSLAPGYGCDLGRCRCRAEAGTSINARNDAAAETDPRSGAGIRAWGAPRDRAADGL